MTSKITSLKGIPRSCASSRSQGINASTGVFHLFATRRWFALECSRQTRPPVVPIRQRREGDLTNIRLKIAFISNHRRRPQQRQDLFETIVCSCMHTHERCVLLHALADFFKSEMPTAKSILSSTCCRSPPSKNEARSIFSASIAVILPA